MVKPCLLACARDAFAAGFFTRVARSTWELSRIVGQAEGQGTLYIYSGSPLRLKVCFTCVSFLLQSFVVSCTSFVEIMRVSTTSLAALGLAQLAKCDLHQLIVGTFTTDNLYTVEFDDSALTLKLLQNKTTTAASSWIALSVSYFCFGVECSKRRSMTRKRYTGPPFQRLYQHSFPTALATLPTTH